MKKLILVLLFASLIGCNDSKEAQSAESIQNPQTQDSQTQQSGQDSQAEQNPPSEQNPPQMHIPEFEMAFNIPQGDLATLEIALKPLESAQKASCKKALGAVPPLTVLLELIYPHGIAGLNYQPYPEDIAFMPEGVSDLPVLGIARQGSMNLEEVAKHHIFVIFFDENTQDLIVQPYEQLGIRTARLKAFDISDINASISGIVALLGEDNGVENACGERLKARAQLLMSKLKFYDEYLEKLNAKVQNKPTVYYAGGFDGLKSICDKNSKNMLDISRIGAVNALKCPLESNGVVNIDFELVARLNPQVIFVREIPFFKALKQNPAPSWASIDALKNHHIYYAPSTPSNWLAFPPSVMQKLGFLWAFSRLHPDLLSDNELKAIAQDFFRTFLRELSDEDYQKLQGLE